MALATRRTNQLRRKTARRGSGTGGSALTGPCQVIAHGRLQVVCQDEATADPLVQWQSLMAQVGARRASLDDLLALGQ